jgi:serine/threonine protein kinase
MAKTRRLQKKRKTTRKKQKGGAVLGSGIAGTAFRPPPCLPGTMPPEVAQHPDNYIGKLMKKDKANEELDTVKKIQDTFFMRRRIPAKHRKYPRIDTDHFFLHYAGRCIPNEHHPDLLAESLKNKKMILYKYGGRALFEFYPELLKSYRSDPDPRKHRTPEKMNIQFINFMRQLSGLLYGVRVLSQTGIIHADIKNDNIVVGEAAFPKVGPIRLIDYGNAFFAKDVNNDDNLYRNWHINFEIWPPEICVSLTEEGLENILSNNMDNTRKRLFLEKQKNGSFVDKRLQYLEILGKLPDTFDNIVAMPPDERRAALLPGQEEVMDEMRDGVAKVLGQILSEKDSDGDYEHEEYFPIFGIEDGAGGYVREEDGSLAFKVDAIEEFLDDVSNSNSSNSNDDENDVRKDVQEFIDFLTEEARERMIKKCDVYSVGSEIYEILTDVITFSSQQPDPGDNWIVSPDTLQYFNEIKAICKRMMDPDVTRRISIEEAYQLYIHTSLFGGAPPPGYIPLAVAGAIENE